MHSPAYNNYPKDITEGILLNQIKSIFENDWRNLIKNLIAKKPFKSRFKSFKNKNHFKVKIISIYLFLSKMRLKKFLTNFKRNELFQSLIKKKLYFNIFKIYEKSVLPQNNFSSDNFR